MPPEPNLLTDVLMPIALGVIMLGLGLSLTAADFRRVIVYPRAVLVGLACQTLVLPFVCFGIAKGFGLPPALAVGLMLLAASPGGATANLFSHLAKGDVALNITLTATNSFLSLLTLPLIVSLSMTQFMGEGREIPMQFGKVVQVFAIILVPVALGMVLRWQKPTTALALERPVRILSALFLVLVVAGAIKQNIDDVKEYFKLLAAPALAFNVASMAVGFFVPLLARVPKKQAIATGMEIGIHNGTLAMFIGTNVLGDKTMAMPPAIYSLIMFFTAAAFGFIVSRGTPEPEPS